MESHQFWQELHPPGSFDGTAELSDLYPAALPDGRQLALPIRVLPGGDSALASLIVNQAGFVVQAALADALAARLLAFEPEVVVGLPTLGLTLAAAVAERLGHARYVPLGTSRKFWYRDELSVALSSITTPEAKRLYIDPRLVPLLEGRRIALVDDVVSSGRSIGAGIELLALLSLEPVVIGAAMLQSRRWRERESAALPGWQERVVGVFETPLLVRGSAAGTWSPTI